MENNQELAIKKTPLPMGAKGVQLESFEALWRFAQCVAASPFAPRGMEKPEAIVTAIQLGLEIGLSPMSALQNVAVINGRPGIYGDAALALVRASGRCEYYKQSEPIGEGDDRKVTVISKRDDSPESITSTFSVGDARKAGLWGKQGPWSQYPDRMLLFRARGFNLRDNFGDILKGLHTVEELSDQAIKPIEGRVVNGDGIKFGPAIPEETREATRKALEESTETRTEGVHEEDGAMVQNDPPKPKRHRRTKAQIEADNAAKNLPASVLAEAAPKAGSSEARESTSRVGRPQANADSRGGQNSPPRATPLEGLRNLIAATPITEFQLENYCRRKGWLEAHQNLSNLDPVNMGVLIQNFAGIANGIADGTNV